MTPEEKDIICRAVDAAIVFGIDWCRNARLELEDHGYKWTPAHEEEAFRKGQELLSREIT